MVKELSDKTSAKEEKNEVSSLSRIMPEVDIFETDSYFVLKADLPGVDKKNLNITIDEGNLLIKAIMADEVKIYSYKEYKLGEYYRSFKVSDFIEKDKIKADLINGVLTLTLTKSEKMKPKKIKIETE